MAYAIDELTRIEKQRSRREPSVAVAYVLLIGLGLFSAHRFYLGRYETAVLQIMANLLLVGLVWLAIDALLLPSMVEEARRLNRQRAVDWTVNGRRMSRTL